MGGRLRLVRTQTPAQTCNAQSSMTHNRGARQPLFLLPRQQLQRRTAQKAECNLRPAHTLVLSEMRQTCKCTNHPRKSDYRANTTRYRRENSRPAPTEEPPKCSTQPETSQKSRQLYPVPPRKARTADNATKPEHGKPKPPTKPRTHRAKPLQDRKSRCKTCAKTQGDLQNYRAMPQAFCRHRHFADTPAADCAPYAV